MRSFQILIFCLFTLVFSQLNGQVSYKVGKGSEAIIVGTSTMHDWESDVEKIEGSGKFLVENGQVKQIPELAVQFEVTSIESGRSVQNRITYDALKHELFPEIKFTIDRVVKVGPNTATVAGNLSIAGTTKRVEVTGKTNVSGSTITIEGSKRIDMTEYGIEPPTAMLGTIKVGKEVTVNFNLKMIAN